MTIEHTLTKPPAEAETLTIRISLPAWTLGHWQTYSKARAEYYASERKAHGEDTPVDPITGRYVGSLALLKAGVVHIEGLEALQKAISEGALGVTDLHVVWFICENVGEKIEAALASPLDWKKSLSVSTSPNGISHH